MEKKFKNEFVSKYKSKLKYVYGDMNEILYKCERHTKSFMEEQPPPKIPIKFNTTTIQQDAVDRVGKINDYLHTLSERTNSSLHFYLIECGNEDKEEEEEEGGNKEDFGYRKTKGGSAYFKAISRKTWERLFNKGKVDVPVGMHRPKYTLLETYNLLRLVKNSKAPSVLFEVKRHRSKSSSKMESEMKICDSLLKIYRETYLKNPKVVEGLKRHVPIINFSKQPKRNLVPETPCKSAKSQARSVYETIDNSAITSPKVGRKVRGLILMEKQLPRKYSPPPPCGPEYNPNYRLVLPRIKTKVNYYKETRKEPKGRMPLLTPWKSNKGRRNNSFIL